MFKALRARTEERLKKMSYVLLQFLSDHDISKNVRRDNLFGFVVKAAVFSYAECLHKKRSVIKLTYLM